MHRFRPVPLNKKAAQNLEQLFIFCLVGGIGLEPTTSTMST